MNPSTSLKKGRDCPSPPGPSEELRPSPAVRVNEETWLSKTGAATPLSGEKPKRKSLSLKKSHLKLKSSLRAMFQTGVNPDPGWVRQLLHKRAPRQQQTGGHLCPCMPTQGKAGELPPASSAQPCPLTVPETVSTSPIDTDTSNDVTMGHRAAFWGPHPEDVLSWLCITNSTVRRQRMGITRALSRVSMVKFVSYSQGLPHLKPTLDSS